MTNSYCDTIGLCITNKMKNNVTTHIWSKLKWSAITGVFFYFSNRFNKQKYQYLIKTKMSNL